MPMEYIQFQKLKAEGNFKPPGISHLESYLWQCREMLEARPGCHCPCPWYKWPYREILGWKLSQWIRKQDFQGLAWNDKRVWPPRLVRPHRPCQSFSQELGGKGYCDACGRDHQYKDVDSLSHIGDRSIPESIRMIVIVNPSTSLTQLALVTWDIQSNKYVLFRFYYAYITGKNPNQQNK